MDHLFESFEELNRSVDERLLESTTARKLFVLLVATLVVLGMNFGITIYVLLHQHRLHLTEIAFLFLWTWWAIRYSRLIYCRL